MMMTVDYGKECEKVTSGKNSFIANPLQSIASLVNGSCIIYLNFQEDNKKKLKIMYKMKKEMATNVH